MLNSPFKFLDAFGKDDRNLYFGRDKETEELYDKLIRTKLMLLYGQSGTGKTSLIQCGLSKRIRDTDWLPIFIRRDTDINQSLNQEIDKRIGSKDQSSAFGEKLESLFKRFFTPVYLFFDQFEELFILGKKKEQELFVQNLLEILEHANFKVILVIREEYIAYLSDFEQTIPELFNVRFRVENMRADNLKEVIVNTGKVSGKYTIDKEETIELILDNLTFKKSAVELTYLQVYLDKLYKKGYTEDKPVVEFNEKLVKSVGKLEDVLGDFIEAQLREVGLLLGKGKSDIPLSVLSRMVTEDGTKQVIDPSELKEELDHKKIEIKDIEFCLNEFENRKILRRIEV